MRSSCGWPFSCMILHNSRTQKSLKSLVIPSCALLQPTTCYTLYSTAPHPPRESLVRRGWRKAATLVSAFMTGTKVFSPYIRSVQCTCVCVCTCTYTVCLSNRIYNFWRVNSHTCMWGREEEPVDEANASALLYRQFLWWLSSAF